MADRSVSVFGCIVMMGLMVGGCAGDGKMGSGAGSSYGGGSAAQTNSLQACLDRVSSGGSAGARQVAEESCRDNEALRLGIVGVATTKSNDRVASGTQGDTLTACMERIPSGASAGQKMLAEQSCRRDQGDRR